MSDNILSQKSVFKYYSLYTISVKSLLGLSLGDLEDTESGKITKIISSMSCYYCFDLIYSWTMLNVLLYCEIYYCLFSSRTVYPERDTD